MLTFRHSVSYRNYSPGRIFQIDGIPWTSCVDRSCFNLPSELLGVFAGWSRHSRRGMATSLASFSSACLGKHPSARSGDSCPPNAFEWHHLLRTKGHHFPDLCRRLNWSLRLCPMTAQLGFPSTCQFLACKKSLQQEMLAACFFAWIQLLGNFAISVTEMGESWESYERVCLCVFIYLLQRSKESWVPSQCCFPLLASLGQVVLLLFLFLVLLVAVAHGAWCVWTAAREPYQSDAETDSSDQEGSEESFVAFSLPHVAPGKTKWNSCKSN